MKSRENYFDERKDKKQRRNNECVKNMISIMKMPWPIMNK